MSNNSPQTPAKPTFRLPKSERLCSTAAIDALFASGKGALAYPLRMLAAPAGAPRSRFVIVVPKKRLRHAVDRVLMRRRIREAYRLCRAPLREAVDADPGLRTFSVAFIYLADKNVDYARVERAMRKLIDKMVGRHFPSGEEEGEGDGHGG